MLLGHNVSRALAVHQSFIILCKSQECLSRYKMCIFFYLPGLTERCPPVRQTTSWTRLKPSSTNCVASRRPSAQARRRGRTSSRCLTFFPFFFKDHVDLLASEVLSFVFLFFVVDMFDTDL